MTLDKVLSATSNSDMKKMRSIYSDLIRFIFTEHGAWAISFSLMVGGSRFLWGAFIAWLDCPQRREI